MRQTATVPVWFMRQAGRSLPEYRSARGDASILEAVRDPALVTELTLQPVTRYSVDAAILFSDIMVPLAAMDSGVQIVAGRGPVIEQRVSGESDLGRLRDLEPEEDIPYVIDAIRLIRNELAPSGIPLIGFAGAPFTLASYLIEGGPSRDHARTKAFMFSEPSIWERLIDKLADIALAFLRAQILAGAQAVQLFDSWAGALSTEQYERYVFKASSKVLRGVAELGVPRIHFGVGTGELLEPMANAGADVIGVDWHVSLADVRKRVGRPIALQGNLDPSWCLAPGKQMEAEVLRILREGSATPGYIFNLGHGVLPETDPSTLARIVELVHAWNPR